jgi:hypothetical protein
MPDLRFKNKGLDFFFKSCDTFLIIKKVIAAEIAPRLERKFFYVIASAKKFNGLLRSARNDIKDWEWKTET